MSAATSHSEVPWAAILAEARGVLANGDVPNRDALVARIRALAPPAEADAVIAQLDGILAVGRARTRLARDPSIGPASKPAPRLLRSALRTRPTLTANMDVRRQNSDEGYALVWDIAPGVAEWEVRIAERADIRSDYVNLETQTLPADVTQIELPLTERGLRIHVVGRARGGKLVRRAVIAGLSLDSWGERWQRRSSAA